MNNLFGSDSDDDDDLGGGGGGGGAGGGAPSAPVVLESKKIGIPDKHMAQPAGGAGMVFVDKSKLMGVETRCFDAGLFDEDKERRWLQEKVDNQVRRDNMIRWRYKTGADGEPVLDAEGNKVPESNARFVKWSDGSLQLWIGDSCVDVVQQQMKSGSYLYKVVTAHNEQGENATCLVSGPALPTTLKFRPSSLKSRAHKELTLDLRQKHQKHARLKSTVTTKDPLAQAAARERRIEETLRTSKRMRNKADMYGRQGGDFLENDLSDSDEDRQNSTSLASLKAGFGRTTSRSRRKGKAGKAQPRMMDSSSYGEEDRPGRPGQRKARAAVDSDDEPEWNASRKRGESPEVTSDSEDEDEEEEVKAKAAPAKGGEKAESSDDDDGDAGDDAGDDASKGETAGDGEEAKADAAEEAAVTGKRDAPSGEGAADEAGAGEEDEEEEEAVAQQPKRKKRNIVVDDDDY